MNTSLDLLERVFARLASRLLEVEGKNSEHESVVQITLGQFILANERLLEAAAKAYSELSDTQRAELANQHDLTTTLLHGQNPNAHGYIDDALAIAHSRHSGVPNTELMAQNLSPFEHGLIEIIPRVLSYAKHVAEIAQPVDMAPLVRHSPWPLEAHATVEADGGKTRIAIRVKGGLTEANRAVFEKIALPDGLGIEREEAAAALFAGGGERSPFGSFGVTLRCSTDSVKAIVSVLQEVGFHVEEK